MPNCFSLTPLGSDTPMDLNDIDAFVCHAFGVTPHDTYYGGPQAEYDWYNSIGFMLACGKTFDEIINDNKNHWTERIVPMAKLLREWFASDAWTEIGRRGSQ